MFDFHTYYYYYYGYDDSKDSATKAELIHVYDEKDATSLCLSNNWTRPSTALGYNPAERGATTHTTLRNLCERRGRLGCG